MDEEEEVSETKPPFLVLPSDGWKCLDFLELEVGESAAKIGTRGGARKPGRVPGKFAPP